MKLLSYEEQIKYWQKQTNNLGGYFGDIDGLLQAQAELTAREIFEELEKYRSEVNPPTYLLAECLAINNKQWQAIKAKYGVK